MIKKIDNKKINKQIGARLRKCREKTMYSQEHVGSFLGLTRGSYVNIEAGRQQLIGAYLPTICGIFQCAYEDIMGSIPVVKIEYKEEIVTRVRKIPQIKKPKK